MAGHGDTGAGAVVAAVTSLPVEWGHWAERKSSLEFGDRCFIVSNLLGYNSLMVHREVVA